MGSRFWSLYWGWEELGTSIRVKGKLTKSSEEVTSLPRFDRSDDQRQYQGLLHLDSRKAPMCVGHLGFRLVEHARSLPHCSQGHHSLPCWGKYVGLRASIWLYQYVVDERSSERPSIVLHNCDY